MTRRSGTRRLLTVVVLALATLSGWAGTALAHDALISSDPAQGSQLATGPREVKLTFNEPVRGGRDYNTVTVLGPDGVNRADGAVRVEGNSVITGVGDLGPAGAYTIGFRVLSNDGHPVSGQVGFTLTQPGPAVAAPPAAATPQPAVPTQPTEQGHVHDDGGMPLWPWILAAVLVVALGMVLALRLGKPKQ